MRLRNLRAGERGPLAPLQRHFTFFTPALIYRYGHFRHHHWHDLFRELNREISLYRINCRPFLSCADQPDPWDSLVWCCKKRDWPTVWNFVTGLAQYDAPNRLFERYGLQELEITDPKGDGLMYVGAFGLMTNQRNVGFVRMAGGLPVWKAFTPDPEIVKQEELLHQDYLTSQHATPYPEAA